MIDLVLSPYARVIAAPRIDDEAMGDFIRHHGLSDLVDGGTPISRIIASLSGDHHEHADLLGEFAGRFCYRSWGKGRSTDDYIANVIAEKHGNVLAHSNVSFIVTGVSRSLSLELIRHHVGTNPSQESQRYVTAEGGEIEIVGYKATRAVVPPLLLRHVEKLRGECGDEAADALLDEFRDSFQDSIAAYDRWQARYKRWGFGGDATVAKKRANEAARAHLPNCTETRLVWTMNLRAARNILEQRGDPHADLEIRRLAVHFAHELKRVAPLSFADAEVYIADDGHAAVRTQHRKV